MPAQKKAAKKAPKKEKSFEETLWDTANKLRGSVESSEYSRAERDRLPKAARRVSAEARINHVVLSLIFLKFVSDKFEERRAELVAEGKEDYLDMVEWSGATWTTRQGCPQGERGGAHQFYTMQNVFYLPETSRWSYIQQHAKQGGGKSEMGMQKEEGNDEGRERSQRTYHAVCAANHPPVRKPIEIDRSSDSGQTVTSLGDIRRSKLSRSPSWPEQSRVHRVMRRLPAGTGGGERSVTDWLKTQPVGDALFGTNYAWILHMVSKLSENGVVGFVLANGSMSTNTKSGILLTIRPSRNPAQEGLPTQRQAA